MKKTRQHLRLDFQRTAHRQKVETRLESSRKRLLALALGASLSGATACGDIEPIPAPDAGMEEPPMVPPQDSGFAQDATAHLLDAGFIDDTGETHDASDQDDSGELEDAGEPEDTGELPPMPPPRDTGPTRDIPRLQEDVGRTVPDTGEVPPMPPPRDSGVSIRDIGRAERDTRRPER